jgi:hypothetical protein
MKRLLPVFVGLALNVNADASARTYVTWAPWQVDSVLVAWVIKRFVEHDVEFEAVAPGTTVASDVALDAPTSRYRRNARRTAFEEAARVLRVESQCIEALRPINRVLELAAWRKSEFPEAEAFELGLTRLLPSGPAKGGLEQAFAFIDAFCAKRGMK